MSLILWSCGTGRNAVTRGQKTTEISTTTSPAVTHTKPRQDTTISRKDVNKARASVINEAKNWLGTKYIYGGHSKAGTDCSGMIMEIFLKVINLKMPRSAWEQQEFCEIISFNSLQPGDLVFFSPGGKYRVSHVGIFIGNNEMIHASASRGVIISNLNENYFKRNYHSAGKVKQLGESLNKNSNRPSAIEVNLEDLEKVLNQKTDSILSSSFME